MKELVGRKIDDIAVSEGEQTLGIKSGDNWLLWDTDADCCSETWFSDIIGVSNMIGAIVKSVEEVDLPTYNVDDGRGRQEVDQVYGYKIYTSKGIAEIIFRNSSNGYYGGSLNYIGISKELPTKVSKIYTQIVKDWNA